MDVDLTDTLVIKAQNLFLVSLRDARLPAREPHPLGLWYRDCRFLSAHELRLDGVPPRLLQASDAQGSRALHELTNRGMRLTGGGLLPAQALSVRVDMELGEDGALHERITVRSHRRSQLRLVLDLVLGADFEPMLAVRGLVQRIDRPPVETNANGGSLSFAALGRDHVKRTTTIGMEPAPDRVAGDRLRWGLDLPPCGLATLALDYRVAEDDGRTARSPDVRRTAPERTRVSSEDELFDRVLARALDDLALLRSELHGYRFYAAGVPWYSTLFGRDSLIAARQVLGFEPDVAAETLRLLARLLGRVRDDERDEAPGKVIHELRAGEPATLGETPFARYYGTADATPLWLCLLAEHADWSGDLNLFRELRTAVDATLAWLDNFGDMDGAGLIGYQSRSTHGLQNHGWKDSWDGVPNPAGDPLEAPIALVEIQGYAIRARRAVARLLELDGDTAGGQRLRHRAAEQEAALDRLWVTEASGYAIGLDGEKRPGTALSSNQGHLLWGMAVSPERARQVRDLMMSPALFSGWGIRTLADGHPSYNPLGYHTGSVWPHDNAMIAEGLRRYGLDSDFQRLFEGQLEAASRFDDYRLPELFAGYDRVDRESPVPYPVACRPQAWSAGAIPSMLISALGLAPDALDGLLRITRPLLPAWLDRLALEGLRIAGARVDLRFERDGDGAVLADAHAEGPLEIVVDAPSSRTPASSAV